MPAVNLHGLERSVYTRIARLALEEKGVAYALHEVEVFGPGGAPAEHRARHPFGRIPALEHDGFWLYETAAITRYVDEAFPGPELQPREPQRRARINQIAGLLDAYAYRPMVWGVFVERVRIPASGGASNEKTVAESLAAARTCLAALDALVGCEPFLLGPKLTLADLHALPILLYFSLAAEGRQLLAGHRALEQWLAMMRSRASVERTRSRYELAR
ncbi:MAG TPA: glutathione S-transferase family protein [Burkholderiales bacterium]